ncbi:MAG: T9SS type A sorting domain-containing protein, partial [Bacteroidales bacterium]|nr:T9SS type A sorting domain-containing protein [Bacteroidales bacterium]
EGIRTDGVYCYEQRVLDISCTPNISDTITGTFRSKRNALEPNGKNKARYYFNRIGNGADTVYYDYDVLGTSYTVEKAVFIDSIGEVSIASSTADFDYCHSVPLVQFTGNQNYTLGGQGEFEYVGSSGVPEITRSSSTAIYPVNEVPGTYSISYAYTSSRGCSAETSHVINIYPEPVTDFSQPVSCPDITTPVPFANLTTFSGNESELTWEWSFEGGLPVTEKNPVYTFQSNGVKQVTLTATTGKGCAVSKSKEYTIGNFAQADFRWDNECNTGEQVTLTSTSAGGVPENASYTWKVEGAVIPGDMSAVYQFADIGEVDVRLLYTSDAGCTDSVTKTIVIQPYIRITKDFADHNYIEDFESGNELYTWQTRGLADADTTRWNLGVPDGDVISNASSGNNSWFTNLADRTDVENSEVVSPCFDLSGLEKPMIKLNIWSSSEFKRDGAVMQYSTDYGNTWKNLGDVNEGINWFNSENIQSQPGGVTQFNGWNEVRMGEWTSARHSLDFLKDEENVRFRIAYAADGGGVEDVDGFAFDDVWIGERQQNVLAEYFTNSSLGGIVEANANMEAYEASRAADIVPIHYHTGSPEGDPLFSDYEEGPSARVFYYGVSSVPEVISNGIIRSGIDNEAIDQFEQEVDVESLRDPMVSIGLSVSRSSAEVTVTALEDLSGESLVLYGAVVKDSIEMDGIYYYNVLRKFLPDPAGIELATGGFANGESITESLPVNLSNASMFIGSRLVVFVQNTISKHVYQSVWSDLSGLTSLAPGNIDDMVDIYPNPATERLFIDSEYEIRRLVITDMTGRVVRILEPDQARMNIPIDDYKYGVYMIRGITDHGEFIKKFIKQ